MFGVNNKKARKELIRMANEINSRVFINFVPITRWWVAWIGDSWYFDNEGRLSYAVCGVGHTPNEAIRSLYRKLKGKKLHRLTIGLNG